MIHEFALLYLHLIPGSEEIPGKLISWSLCYKALSDKCFIGWVIYSKASISLSQNSCLADIPKLFGYRHRT